MLENLPTVSLRISTESHANAMALNKECNQIAVGGRNILKIYQIDNDGFTEVSNMRAKHQNLSYSSNDVAWSTLDSNLLATAATNGVVSVWDISKFRKSKQLLIYTDHERTAHSVAFHSSESNILISGSQDGTIKCFDTRYEKSVCTYFSNSESVRDVKFSPHTMNIFSAVSENGTVQLWDLRKWDKCILQFTAHSGPIYTCDWHPTKNWLATGSRDKQIKVWNMDGKASLEHTIHTIAVVGRVKWRPERTYHIASCALVMDYSIHVWDIRRPFIPFASFNDHTNVTTGIAWKGGDSHCLLSTSKDSTLYKHAFKDATRPAAKATTQGASLGRRGDVYFANKIKKLSNSETAAQVVKSNTSLTRQRSLAGIEQFHQAHSTMCGFMLKSSFTGFVDPDASVQVKDDDCFVGCAKELLLTGKKLADICEHNANVCKKYGKYNATTLWNFIKVLYGTNEFMKQRYEHRASFSKQKQAQHHRRVTQIVNENMAWQQHVDDMNGNDGNQIELDDDDLNGVVHNNHTNPPASAVIISETQILTEITFENFDLLRNGFIYVGPPDFTKALSFPETALHHDVHAARPQLEMKVKESREKTPPNNIPSILKINHIPPIPMWEPHQFVADALLLQSDVGDVQTALCILIAMGETRKLLPIEDKLVDHWFHTYIDQLHRYQLWNEACTIINLSWVRSVRESNQQSTAVHTNCGECGRPLNGTVGWYCQKCKSMQASKCCICGLIVRGLYVWCQGCSHGGHLEHLMEYFANRSKCPKCGHLCTYN